MSGHEYRWRQLSPQQRVELVAWRKQRRDPWHSPPHLPNFGHLHFHITAACFEHQPFIGHHLGRMDDFARDLLAVFGAYASKIFAWCVLPNHYHVLVDVADVIGLLRRIGQLHGRTSYEWNGEEACRGRQVWFNAAETAMKSERHFWATMNYVQHNAVRHGYVTRWTEWPYCSAQSYLDRVGRDEAVRIWKEYPLLDYGNDWDPPDL